MITRAEGWLQYESCGHNAMPLDPEFEMRVRELRRPYQPTRPTN